MVIVSMVTAVSCGGDPEPAPAPKDKIVIPASSQSVSFDQGASSKQVNFTANASWTVSMEETTKSTPSWLSVSPMSGGTGNISMTVNTEINPSKDPRSATIKINSGGESFPISVSQKGSEETGVSVTGVTLDKTSLSFVVGSTESQTLVATVSPEDATDKSVTWSSSDESVVKVEDGVVSLAEGAVAGGSAVVSVTTTDGGHVASCAVSVVAEAVAVTGVTLDKSSISFVEGSTVSQTLTASVLPVNASNKSVGWRSSDESVVTVVDGVVSLSSGAKSGDEATVTVATVDGSFEAVCNVSVVKNVVAVTGVTLDKPSLSFVVGSTETQQLRATVNPDDATNKNVSWSSSDESVANVSSAGVVSLASGVEAGKSATITVTTEDGNFRSNCIVSVVSDAVAVSSITLDKSELSFVEGSTDPQTLVAKIMPANATNQNVVWASSNTDVVSVNGGVVRLASGSKAGEKATITATTIDGGFVATCNVEVLASVVAVTGVTIDKPKLLFAEGSTDPQSLVATVMPSNATTKAVNWSSSDESVANVSSAGVVSLAGGVTAGKSATITATTIDGGFTATSTVEVVGEVVAVTGVTLDKPSLSFVVGSTETQQLKATITPGNATNSNVTWSSSNTDVVSVNDGVVKLSSGAVAGSTATITVTTEDGDHKASATVNVISDTIAVEGVIFTAATFFITQGSTNTYDLNISVEITPENATNKDLIWKSSDESVVIVNSEGIATLATTARAGDKATVTVKTVDGGHESTMIIEVRRIPVSSVSLDITSLEFEVGSTVAQQLTATVLPADATNPAVTWSTSNATVATVSASGEVSLAASASVGQTATITVTTVDGGYEKTAEVRVIDIKPTSVKLNETLLQFEVGSTITQTLFATVLPASVVDKSVTWTSSDSSVATVSDGVVSLAPGAQANQSALITATTNNGGLVANCTVKVLPKKVTSISLDQAKLTFKENSTETQKLTATVLPADATDLTVKWSSSNAGIAQVSSDGTVKLGSAAKLGDKATITAQSSNLDLPAATCEIEVVTNPVTGVKLNMTKVAMYPNATPEESVKLVAEVLPGGASNKDVSWSVLPANIVDVDASGVVTPLAGSAVGDKAIVTATTADGSYTATCEVNMVLRPVTDVDLYLVADESTPITSVEIDMTKGKTVDVKVGNILPANAIYTSVNIISADASVVTVTPKGGDIFEITGVTTAETSIKVQVLYNTTLLLENTYTVKVVDNDPVEDGTPPGITPGGNI